MAVKKIPQCVILGCTDRTSRRKRGMCQLHYARWWRGGDPSVNRQGQLTHGHARAKGPEYHAWQHMKGRCYRANDSSYPRYGARGIGVCSRWLNSYENFVADVGIRPSPAHSLHRKDNNGNYEPSNVVWATKEEQNRNQTSTILLTIDAVELCVAEWSKVSGVSATTIYSRIKAGRDPRSAVFGKVRRR